MAEANDSQEVRMHGRTAVQRTSDRELVITRTFDGPARIVFAAWTTPELLKRWWAPKSNGMTLLLCDVDVRTGGRYRFEFGRHESSQTIAFFGRYLEVVPPLRLVWTNEESEEAAVTTVTFEEQGGKTLLVLTEVYPTRQALDNYIEGMEAGSAEQFDQLDELLATLGHS